MATTPDGPQHIKISVPSGSLTFTSEDFRTIQEAYPRARIRLNGEGSVVIEPLELRSGLAGRSFRYRAERILDAWCFWMPQRVLDEQLGDVLEDLHRRIGSGQPKWLIRGKVVASMFWLTCASVGYFRKTMGTKRAK